MRHGHANRERTGRVHGLPQGGGNVSSLCGELPLSGTLNREAVDLGRWYSTAEPIDCQRCIRRLETIADQVGSQHGRDSLRRSWQNRPVGLDSGVCPECGRVRRVKADGTMGSHNHRTAAGYNAGRCRGIGKPPSWLVIRPEARDGQ